MRNKYFFCLLILFASVLYGQAQNTVREGKVNKNIKWSFDGYTLTISVTSLVYTSMPDYDPKTPAPWTKEALPFKKVVIGDYIENIGSCAFISATELTDVEIESTVLSTIGWGAFFKCQNLRTFSIPSSVTQIAKLAFANCSQMSSIEIPDECRVEDMAFASTTALSSISIGDKAVLGKDVFSNEIKENGNIIHLPSNAAIAKLPQTINERNCTKFGLSEEQVKKYLEKSSVSALVDNGGATSVPVSRDITAKSFTQELTDLSASTRPRLDLNEQFCALVKVMLPTDGATFGGNVIGDVARDGSEYLVYMTEGTKRITIKHPDYNRLTVQFADLGINQLEGKRTYSLVLVLPENTDAKKQKLSVRVYPSDAIVLIDGIMMSITNGKGTMDVTVGNHSYNVAKNGYIAQKGSIVVMEENPAKLLIELDEKTNDEEESSDSDF